MNSIQDLFSFYRSTVNRQYFELTWDLIDQARVLSIAKDFIASM